MGRNLLQLHHGVPLDYSGVGAGNLLFSGLSEWFKELVLKTSGVKASVGSNPTPTVV